ncbi:hypothetical protein [Streptomyces pactum]|uniref:hypothetical protein n=1 Tax=Streptomyces pactum TaxID=68249 RepID=UPI0036F5E758
MSALALATGCGGSDGDAEPRSSASGTAGHHGGGHQSPLQRLLLDQPDVAGYTVTEHRTPDPSGELPRSSDPRCAPLAHATGERLGPYARDVVARGISRAGEQGRGVTVTLASYPGDRARHALAALARAVRECRDGFEVTVRKTEVRYEKVRPGTTPPRGDRSLAYAMTAVSQGQKVLLNFTAVRSGRIIALFAGVNLKDYTAGHRIPQELIDKQVAKVERARRTAAPARPERTSGGTPAATGSTSTRPATDPERSGTPARSGTSERSGGPERSASARPSPARDAAEREAGGKQARPSATATRPDKGSGTPAPPERTPGRGASTPGPTGPEPTTTTR